MGQVEKYGRLRVALERGSQSVRQHVTTKERKKERKKYLRRTDLSIKSKSIYKNDN